MPYQIFVELSRKHQRAKSLLVCRKKEKYDHINQKETERSVPIPNAVEWKWSGSIPFRLMGVNSERDREDVKWYLVRVKRCGYRRRSVETRHSASNRVGCTKTLSRI